VRVSSPVLRGPGGEIPPGYLPTKKIVKTYNSKNLVEDDFKLLNDHLLVPVGPVYHHKDENIRVHVFLL
jgi:transposase